ncbi:MAG: 30S ribosomal protein S8e [Candidatus Lokiarchaeota archaeon]|nr:30S ribosomal protein S8e [Candidatus Lokiarchaeota archaeon]
MVVWQGKSKRKKSGSGGRRKRARSKKAYEMGSPAIETFIGPSKTKFKKARGHKIKQKILQAEEINVTDKNGVTKKVKISTFIENKASIDYNRRKIITKGAILETELGKIKVTSRPGQIGQLNGILI